MRISRRILNLKAHFTPPDVVSCHAM